MSHNYFLIVILLLFFSISIHSNVPDRFTGIWRGQHTIDSKDDSFIAIMKLSDKNYFVLFVKPFGEHQLDYAEHGELNDEGYIVVNAYDSKFFLELTSSDFLYHFWTLDDWGISCRGNFWCCINCD